MFKWFKKHKELKDVHGAHKTVIVNDILYKIKKVDPLNFLEGSNSVLKTVALWDEKKALTKKPEEVTASVIKKMRAHQTDVFMASVIHPVLCRKEEQEDDSCTWVGHIFKEPEMAARLYDEIVTYTYGKKKIQSLITQRQSSPS